MQSSSRVACVILLHHMYIMLLPQHVMQKTLCITKVILSKPSHALHAGEKERVKVTAKVVDIVSDLAQAYAGKI